VTWFVTLILALCWLLCGVERLSCAKRTAELIFLDDGRVARHGVCSSPTESAHSAPPLPEAPDGGVSAFRSEASPSQVGKRSGFLAPSALSSGVGVCQQLWQGRRILPISWQDPICRTPGAGPRTKAGRPLGLCQFFRRRPTTLNLVFGVPPPTSSRSFEKSVRFRLRLWVGR